MYCCLNSVVINVFRMYVKFENMFREISKRLKLAELKKREREREREREGKEQN